MAEVIEILCGSMGCAGVAVSPADAAVSRPVPVNALGIESMQAEQGVSQSSAVQHDELQAAGPVLRCPLALLILLAAPSVGILRCGVLRLV